MSKSGGLAEADRLFSEGTKLINPSVLALRFKAQWSTATPLFERAGLLYRQHGELAQARTAFERAAKGQERQNSGWHAAKNWEKAADIARAQSDAAGIESCSLAAAEQYCGEGRLPAAADAAVKGARALETLAPEVATKLYAKAIEWLEDSGKDGTSGDTYRLAIAHAVRGARWEVAGPLLLRFAASCDAAGASSSQAKAYLGAVVVWLSAARPKEAWAVYQDALAVSAFCTSNEAFAAEALFDAYRTAFPAAVAAAVSGNQAFLHLDNQLARLAKKLGEGPVAEIEAALPGGGGPPRLQAAEAGEEDLT
ncbi:SNAPG1 [Auxenochlorella protothecoides x Auxenochlorella symbiontica]|uniref:Gamma-soluble NSF attachment protein n=1 Tax=Auxenochlorella protothecoides TaxID=3075 RepID=A0A087SH56_AUXPR|nr:Gamma-soluble NSF attachment protein [Auxenochlorella protothecoides]KFM25060.1 Gamma-soluble NSF attachment protein [Auxenochlorella protothecoides]